MIELTLEKIKEMAGMLPEWSGGDFYVVVHPSNFYRLKVIEARDEYYRNSHIRRWESRYGKTYPTGQLGGFSDFTITDNGN